MISLYLKPVEITIRDGFYITFENYYNLWDLEKQEIATYEFAPMIDRDGVQTLAIFSF